MIFRGAWIPTHKFLIAKKSSGWSIASDGMTEHRRAEKTVRESEERLRLAAQVGKMYAFDWDVATDLVVRSEEGSHILGLTGGPMSRTHQQVLASVHPDDRATFNTAIAECTPESPNTQISYRLLRPDGSVFWME